MESDPNINPVWDMFLGEQTDTGMLRLLALIAAFVVVGGAVFSAF